MNKILITLFFLWSFTLGWVAYKWLTAEYALQGQIIHTDKLNESFEEYLRTYGKVNKAYNCTTREIQ